MSKHIEDMRIQNEILKQDLKIKKDLLENYIQCFRKKAHGKLTSCEIEQIIKDVYEIDDDLSENDD